MGARPGDAFVHRGRGQGVTGRMTEIPRERGRVPGSTMDEELDVSYAKQMLDTYPRSFNLDAGLLAAAIDALADCGQACDACADACLGEQDVANLVKCVRLNLDCADVCATTKRVLSRQTEYDANVTRALVQACVASCRACGDECEQHGEHGMEHCRVCAEACRRCEQACTQLLEAMNV